MGTENNDLPETLKDININCSAVWKDIAGTYTSAKGLYIGKVLVVSYSYNGLRSKDSVNEDYVVKSTIPNIKSNLGKYGTEEECKKRCIEVANHFLKMIQNNS